MPRHRRVFAWSSDARAAPHVSHANRHAPLPVTLADSRSRSLHSTRISNPRYQTSCCYFADITPTALSQRPSAGHWASLVSTPSSSASLPAPCRCAARSLACQSADGQSSSFSSSSPSANLSVVFLNGEPAFQLMEFVVHRARLGGAKTPGYAAAERWCWRASLLCASNAAQQSHGTLPPLPR